LNPLPHGIYERLVDEYLRDVLARHPELRTVLCQIDPEEQPARYASFVAKILEQALKEETDPERRLQLCNRILGSIAAEPGRARFSNTRNVTSVPGI
jgi:hypothetical protein